MPCPHFKITICKRSKGQSAVAGAAYQSGESLFSEYDQKRKSYTEKKGIVYTEIMLPANAPPEYKDREKLWNAVEMNEKQWNSQLARRIVLALPKEIPREEQIMLLQKYCKEQFADKGMCVDIALHDKDDGNPHAHIMLTMRAIDEHGKWLPKSRKVYDLDRNGERIRLPSGEWKSHKENTVDWNEQSKAEEWRHAWEVNSNLFLERNKCCECVDLRSFERQGITDKAPTVHMGAAVFQMEKRGVHTLIGDLNRDIKKSNALMAAIKKTIASLREWIKKISEEKKKLRVQYKKELTVIDLLFDYLKIRDEERKDWNKFAQQNAGVKDLRKIVEVINHVSRSNIVSISDLDKELAKLRSNANRIRTEMRKKENRIKALSVILKSHDTIEKLSPVHNKYVKIQWKSKKEKYVEEHRSELDEYNKAVRYLKKQSLDEHVNYDTFKTEIKFLRFERDSLQTELEKLYEQINPLKDVRYYISKVIPLDNELPTTEEKKSVVERISQCKKECEKSSAHTTEVKKNEELE